jgi:hypothetical protein
MLETRDGDVESLVGREPQPSLSLLSKLGGLSFMPGAVVESLSSERPIFFAGVRSFSVITS